MTDYLDRLAPRRRRRSAIEAAPPASTLAAARLVLLDTLGAIVAGSALPENRRLAELAAERSRERPGDLARPPDAGRCVLGRARQCHRRRGARDGRGQSAGAAATRPFTSFPARWPSRRSGASAGGGCSRPSSRATRSARGSAAPPRPGPMSTRTAPGARSAPRWPWRDSARSDGRRLRQVINLAASMSPANTWTPALEGADHPQPVSRPLGVSGHPRRRLWRTPASPRSGDAPSDVYGTILADRFEPALAVDGLGGASYRIEENYFKFYACCRYNHFALDAIAAMRRAHPLSSEEVAAVQVTTIPFGLRMADADPASMLAAKFSVPSCRGGHPRARPCRPRRLRGRARSPIPASATSPAGWRSPRIPRWARGAPTIPPRACASRCGTDGRSRRRRHHRPRRRAESGPRRRGRRQVPEPRRSDPRRIHRAQDRRGRRGRREARGRRLADRDARSLRTHP